MNPNLLAVVNHSSGRQPVMLDGVPVPAESGPFLITSSKALLWVERAFGDGFLRLGVRPTSLDDESQNACFAERHRNRSQPPMCYRCPASALQEGAQNRPSDQIAHATEPDTCQDHPNGRPPTGVLHDCRDNKGKSHHL